MPDRPNVLFIMTDQHRGDAVGADPACPTDDDGRPLVHTPNIDNFAGNGALFSRAYTPAPTCIPARRCLWTGQTPATSGSTTWVTDDWEFENTLPRQLRNDGYQTMLAGKTHSQPPRNHFGFEKMQLHAALGSSRPNARARGVKDDYIRWLDQQVDGETEENAHGLDRNSWDPRPWHLDERLHPTNWTTTRAIEFVERRDPTRPFFMYLSYVRPHQPFDPPRDYWDMYVDRDLPEPYMGDWVEDDYGDLIPEYPPTSAPLADLSPTTIHRARAAYYGLITHIDHQIHRLLTELGQHGELGNTIIVFTSDHGEMLGDHHHWRKSYAWEGSARVPFLVQFPRSMREEYDTGRVIDRPVGLEDVMPTLLEAADVEIPDTVEGRSLFPLFEDADADWRDAYHGEHGPTYEDADACQYLVDERTKYVWNPVTGSEYLFDLERDPGEEENLAADDGYAEELADWRSRLADRLADRPEGFSDGDALRTVDPEAWIDDEV